MKEGVTLELIYGHLIQLGKTVTGLVHDFENFTIITARNFTRLESKVDENTEGITTLNERVDFLNERVDSLESRVHGTELGIVRIERLHFKKLEGLEHDILDARTKITRLSTTKN